MYGRGSKTAGRRVVLRFYRFSRAPAVVALWAFAPPISVERDTLGVPRLTIGGGRGAYEVVTRSCSGDVLSSEAVPWNSVGAQLDVPLPDGFRVTAFGARQDSDERPSLPVPGVSGTVGGIQFARESESFGFGLGVAQYGVDRAAPSLHARFGDPAKFAWVVDVAPPTPNPAITGVLRAGPRIERDRFDATFGLGAGRGFEDSEWNSGVFLDGDFQVAGPVGLRLESSYFPGEGRGDWGLAAGLRIDLGR